MAAVSVAELQGCDNFWYFGTWWCMWLLELGASCWLLAGLRFWWMEFSFCIGCYNTGFFGTSCWLLAASRDAGWSLAVAAWWKFLLAAGIVVPARWIFLVQELISVISWILLEC